VISAGSLYFSFDSEFLENDASDLLLGRRQRVSTLHEPVQHLARDVEITLWSDLVFDLSKATLEALSDRKERFDFAVLVLTPDDLAPPSEALQIPRAESVAANAEFSAGSDSDRRPERGGDLRGQRRFLGPASE
jgi:hypothetical protein